MKTVTITLPPELDAAAAAEAKRLGTSKSELIRRGLRAVLPDAPQSDRPKDLWEELGRFGSPDVSLDPGEIDDIVYGR
jgi:Arc/MetJ-type ribon-helix-helix transcriptional regulator